VNHDTLYSLYIAVSGFCGIINISYTIKIIKRRGTNVDDLIKENEHLKAKLYECNERKGIA